MPAILVTGSRGLIGGQLVPLLKKYFSVIGFDIADGTGDVRDTHALCEAMANVDGVIHLAAVSRVVWGQQDPAQCWAVNAEASQTLLRIAGELPQRPWVLAASSREVYGDPSRFPVTESAPLAPINVYGRSKLALEEAVTAAKERGQIAAVVRFANVYGRTQDHHDRALPAFCAAAAKGYPLRVDGSDTQFDFTHVEDAARGAFAMAKSLQDGIDLPPIHLLTGRGASLMEAAQFAVAAAGTDSQIRLAPPRDYDVSHFVGDPTRAEKLLGWKARICLEDGIADLVHRFAKREWMPQLA